MSRLFFCILITVTCVQCKYSPSGENFNEIREPSDIQTQISIKELDSDTVNLYRSRFVNYEIQPEGGRFIEAQIYLAGELIQKNPRLSDGFQISLRDLSNESYKLELQAHFSSGTGSLADTLDLDRAVASRQWLLVIDKIPSSGLQITNVEEVDAGLLIEWEKYDRSNFLSYYITKQNRRQRDQVTRFEFTDPEITSVIDSSYLGESVDLSVFLDASTGHAMGERYTYVSPNRTQFNEPNTRNEEFILSWSKTPYETDFDRYVLYARSADSRYDNSQEIESFYNAADTTLSLEHIPFGKGVELLIETYYSGPSNISTLDTLALSSGEEFVSFYSNDAIAYSQELDKYVILRESSIEILNTETGTVENVINIQRPKLIKNGILGLTYVQGELNLGKYNEVTFALEKSVPFSLIFDKNIEIKYFEPASDSPIVVLGSDSLYVVNYETKEILARHYVGENYFGVKISSQGNLITIKGNLYAINSGVLELIRSKDINNYVQTFFPAGNSDRYYEVTSSNVTVVKEFEGTNRNNYTEKVYQGEYLGSLKFDKFQNTLIGVSSRIRPGHYFYRTHLYLFDEQREIEHAIIDPTITYFYTNNYIFSAAGIRKRLE